jgi:dTDP-4-dehydrorhamnose reductase
MAKTREPAKVLLLGASGYIGRHALAAMDTSRTIGTYCNTPFDGGIYFDPTKMCVSDIIPSDAKIEHAVILFAQLGLDACKADLAASNEINVRGAVRAIADLMELGIKPVYTSSQAVFDGEKGGYTEDDVPVPCLVYGSQKYEVERYLSRNCDDYAILRLATVIGTELDDGTIVSSWINQVQRGEAIKGAYDQIFSPVHVDDVVKAIEATIQLDLSGLYQVAGPDTKSRLEMLQTFVETLGSDAKVVGCSIFDFNPLDNRPRDLSMSSKKFKEATGISFKTFRQCCEELAQKATLTR